ncbi:MAG: peptidylprolyl isomerase [bacterium]|nr:MAG: peptidylprolyl isomerase [bacterium]
MKMTVFFLVIMVFALPEQRVFTGEKEKDVVVIETEFGNIVMELEETDAPLHSANFKKLVRDGFYDSTTFHRVVPNFVIQGGDPLSKNDFPGDEGRGGPGYTIPAEIGLPHLRGAVGAARQGDAVNPEKASNGSQFYICLQAQPYLDRLGYTIFGKIVEGMEVVDLIAQQPLRGERPQKDIRMKRVYMVRWKPTE